MIWLVLWGCGAAVKDTVETESWDAWVWSDTGAEQQAEASELLTYLERLSEDAPRLVAEPIEVIHAEAMAFAEEDAPTIVVSTTETFDSTYWMGVYVTSERVLFNGPLSTWDARGHYLDGIEAPDPVLAHYLDYQDRAGLWTFSGLGGQTDIFAIEGEMDFSCVCFAVTGTVALDSGEAAWFSQLRGLSSYSDPALVAGTWLEGGRIRAELDQFYTEDPTTSARTVALSGSVMWSEHERGVEVALVLERDEAGACEVGEAGVARLFTPESGWAEWQVASAVDCSLCVEDGSETRCTAPLPLLDWTEAPL